MDRKEVKSIVVKKWCYWVGRETTLQVGDGYYKGYVGRNREGTYFIAENGEHISISKKSVRSNGKGGLIKLSENVPKDRPVTKGREEKLSWYLF